MRLNLYYYVLSKKIQYDTHSGIVTLSSKDKIFIKNDQIKKFHIDAALGIIKKGSSKYFLFISQSEYVSNLENENIYKIKKVEFLPVSGPKNSDMENIKTFIEQNNFYYTYKDLEKFYIWNRKMKKNFVKYHTKSEEKALVNDRSPFSTFSSRVDTGPSKKKKKFLLTHSPPSEDFLVCNLVSGYFENQVLRYNTDLYSFEIKSFISTKKIGPRMLSRGIDSKGNVSFFVKTKFLIKKEDLSIFSFKIFRGSVPLYWAQPDPLLPYKIEFKKNKEENKKAFKKHIKRFKEQNLLVIDLLGHKKYENLLSKKYQENCVSQKVKYFNFNMNSHREDYENLKTVFYDSFKSFIEKDGLESMVKQYSMQSQETINEVKKEDFLKKGFYKNEYFMRVNCLDCLDRTNLCQFMIFNYFNPYKFKIIKNMWKNNGNALANFYTGSLALNSEFSKENKRTILSKMNDLMISANRMINNTYTDKYKQRVINIILQGYID